MKKTWRFAKTNICCDYNQNMQPSFCASVAFKYFEAVTKDRNPRYNTPGKTGLPKWIQDVMLSPKPSEMIPFDLSPINPSSIKKTYEVAI